MLKYIIIGLFFTFNCKNEPNTTIVKNYPNVIGDIEYNSKTDGDFNRCDKLSTQYYSFGGLKYEGEMSAIKDQIKTVFQSTNEEGQSGFVTIRFLVNCHGESGMFRLFSTDLSLNEFTFNTNITEQLLSFTKGLKRWKAAEDKGYPYDYHQYLTYKLIDGVLIDISP